MQLQQVKGLRFPNRRDLLIRRIHSHRNGAHMGEIPPDALNNLLGILGSDVPFALWIKHEAEQISPRLRSMQGILQIGDPANLHLDCVWCCHRSRQTCLRAAVKLAP
jgi:hypothetical protein